MKTVTLHFVNRGKRRTWTGDIAPVAGENIFDTAARTYAKRAKRAMPALIPGRSFVR